MNTRESKENSKTKEANQSNTSIITSTTNQDDDISTLVEKYISRKLAEEIEFAESKGGQDYIIKYLQTDIKKGITDDSISERKRKYGENKRQAKLKKGFFGYVKEACKDTLIRILILVCIGMIVVYAVFDRTNIQSAFLDSISIIIAVVLSIGVSSFNNYQKEKQFLALYKISQSSKTVNVLRNGSVVKMKSSELVVGDVVEIEEGMEIPADGWIIQSNQIKADESLITGENDTVAKETYENARKKKGEVKNTEDSMAYRQVPSPVLLSGSQIQSGNGKFIVLQVGPKSSSGKIGDLMIGDSDPTPLQLKLTVIAKKIGIFSITAAVSIVVVLSIKFIITKIADPSTSYTELINYVIIGLATAVASIPEGLPLAVTIALAYSAKKMVKDNNLVRNIAACETMGGVNVICSDKTGTLTQNKIGVEMLYFPSKENKDPQPVNNKKIKEIVPESLYELTVVNFACNNNAKLQPPSGSKTDLALLEYLKNNEVDIDSLKEKYVKPDTKGFSFSSMRKRSGIIIDLDGTILLEKGAAEMILASCSQMHLQDGSVVEIGEKEREELNKIIEGMSKNALRVLATAYKKVDGGADLESKDDENIQEVEKSGLIFTGFIGQIDKLRDDVQDTVAKCKKAGIRVKMVTGDNHLTAKAMAEKCGILSSGSKVMEGEEFIKAIGGVICIKCKTAECDCPRTISQAKTQKKEVRVDTIKNGPEFDHIIETLDVMARARPQDKYALIVGLKERNYVVAVTGDGANDAPALKKADVGFAMGKSGTEIAREAADIVLLDDRLATIVRAVVWGRNVYDNIRKFLQFQLTINVAAVFLIIAGSTSLSSSIFTPVQLLWINLVMDTLASLALAAEVPDEDVLNREPHKKDERIISGIMLKHIIGQSVYQISILCVIIFFGDRFIPENLPDELDADGKSMIYREGTKFIRSGRLKHPFSIANDYHPLEITYGPSRHMTIVFNTFVFLQVFGFFSARRIDDSFNIFKGLFKNYLFMLIVVIVSVVQTIFVELGGENFACSQYGLSLAQWGICLGVGAFGLVINFVLKIIPFPRKERKLAPESKIMNAELSLELEKHGKEKLLADYEA